MIETYFDNVICSCCGHVNHSEFCVMEPISSDWDLDGRDSCIDERMLGLMVNECENCGFACENLDDEILLAEKTVKSERYKNCDGLKTDNVLVQRFIKNALLHEVSPMNARLTYYSYKHASWVCDDIGEIELANELRKRAVAHLENDRFNWTIRDVLYAADMLRRAGEFQRSIDLLTEDIVDSEGAAMIARFLIEKAREGDTERYYLDHVTNEINPRPVPVQKESLRDIYVKEIKKLAEIKARLNNDV